MKEFTWIVLFLFNIYGCVRNSDFIQDGKIVNGNVYKIIYSTRGHFYTVYYKYHVNGRIITGIGNYHKFENQNLRNEILKQSFPVIYLGRKPNVSRVLITQYDFELLGLDYPDSLKWVEDLR